MKWLLLLSLLFVTLCYGQKPVADLPNVLSETSALLLIDNEFYTINDSGNNAKIHIFNKKGVIIHSCQIENAENYDWEALAYDGTSIYIGDIGNNNNDRQNLRIYKVNQDSVRMKDSVSSQTMKFHYEGQSSFPPVKQELYFDAESLIYKNDSLFIFTKNRTSPFDGVSRVYYIPQNSGEEVQAVHLYDLKLNPTNWMEESITDAHQCGEYIFLLTYAKVYSFRWKGSTFLLDKIYDFDGYTQKEGLALDKKYFYITDENESIISGGNKLYKLRR